MSSPLEGRIRAIAREEATQAVEGVGVLNTTDLDAHGLQQQITDLHEHLHLAATTIKRLESRIDALEKTAWVTSQEERPTVRRTRKTTTPE